MQPNQTYLVSSKYDLLLFIIIYIILLTKVIKQIPWNKNSS